MPANPPSGADPSEAHVSGADPSAAGAGGADVSAAGAGGADVQSESTEAQPEEHLSRAERRAASKGRAVRDPGPPWSAGKVHGSRGAAPARKQYSNRRSG
jgi:hypothetical protein